MTFFRSFITRWLESTKLLIVQKIRVYRHAFAFIVHRLLFGFLRQQDRVNVGQHTTGRDGDGAQELGQLLVVANRELNVSRHDARFFVIAGRVAGQFEHFRGEVFEHGGQVDRGARAHARGVLASLQVSRDATDRELQASLGGSARGLFTRLSFSSSRHCRAFVRARVDV